MAERLVLRVRGMTCGGCEQRLATAVRRADGVREATADHTAGVLEVELAPGADHAGGRGRLHRHRSGGVVMTTPVDQIPAWAAEPGNLPGHARVRARIAGLYCSLCTGTIKKALGPIGEGPDGGPGRRPATTRPQEVPMRAAAAQQARAWGG